MIVTSATTRLEGCTFSRNAGRDLTRFNSFETIYTNDPNIDAWDLDSNARLPVSPLADAPSKDFLDANDLILLKIQKVLPNTVRPCNSCVCSQNRGLGDFANNLL
jgi:hypothetical protein